jgi:hypothetical protein
MVRLPLIQAVNGPDGSDIRIVGDPTQIAEDPHAEDVHRSDLEPVETDGSSKCGLVGMIN